MTTEVVSAEILDAGFALAVQILGDRNDAADAVQDCVHRMLRQPGRYDPAKGSARGWFLKVIRNGCIDRIRRSRRTLSSATEIVEYVDAQAPSPAAAAEASELHEKLRCELQRLSPEHREIILLRDWHDLSYAEISEVLSIPCGTVMSRLSRAREELRQRMQPYW